MYTLIDMVMIVLVLTNLILLGTSRLRTCIELIAIQGIALGVLPLLVHGESLGFEPIVFSAIIITLKGVVFPWVLVRALSQLNVRREVEPFVGYGVSLILGPLALASCLWIGSRLPLPGETVSTMSVPVGLFTMMAGLFLIVSRKKALTQVMGYLVLENGINAMGVAIAKEQPYLVELGILLDVFVAVFVMGIIIFHINREFDHIDTDQMSSLRS
ncbi:MAG: hydrogenase [Phycisphaerae bacterium]|jgi:hydrogenase-4 component E|nr:hydrogenase [Phycisphaerae bacterium]